MNAGAVDQSIAIAMQSVTHAARPADTASCAASSQVSLVGPADSLPTQAWNWSMQPPSRSVAATFREPAHRITVPARTENCPYPQYAHLANAGFNVLAGDMLAYNSAHYL